MKIKSVRIRNFRSFDDITIPFNNYACFVGPNGAGKSTVLTALNVFFREYENHPTDLSQLDIEDFHCRNTDNPIRITVTFTELNEEAQEDFSDYYRQGLLVVSAVATFDEDSQKAEVKQFGERLGMSDFAPFFRALDNGEKVAVLKEIYSNIRTTYTDLPAPGTKETMKSELRSYENSHPDDCELIPSEDQFYGFSRGSNRLAKHIQWVYVPAVKDATSEQIEAKNTALGKLLSRTVRLRTDFDQSVRSLRMQMQEQYQVLLDENQHVLDEVSDSLQNRLTEWAHPGAKLSLQWQQDPDRSVRVEEPWAHILAGEGEFEGELSRFGHGLQRSYLLALLQELAGTDVSAAPTLILACEEPELYQHPPQARYLADVLKRLSSDNTQIIITTHNPLFVSGEGFEDVRMIRKASNSLASSVSYMSYVDISDVISEVLETRPQAPEGALAKINQALQPGLNEMFFTRRLVLVEGLEDVAYILSYINLLDRSEEIRRIGCHIVSTQGKSELLQPFVIAKHMSIPTYLVFDSDADKPDRSGSRSKHEKDNKALLKLADIPNPNAFPDETFWSSGVTMWHSDIGTTVQSEIGISDWAGFSEQADIRFGQVGGLKKNTLHIGTSLSIAWDAGKQSESLIQLCDVILNSENYIGA
ncbi:MAG: AAA family ATPase [Gemmatimonadetes bacterium]|nr:AAA family ATPase [Gemmatimonadota bacterium]MYB60391.1 AAA family ATPase [Gemmatimonadota bacterium]